MTSDRKPGGILTVDLDAIADNWTQLCALSEPASCGAVVKADAYGLGLEPVGRFLHSRGCTRFLVARLEEGVALRRVLDKSASIYVLDGPGDAADGPLFDEANLIPVLNSRDQIALWQRHAMRTERVHRAVIHIDTGMARLGLSAADTRATARSSSCFDGLAIDYVMTHLACGDDPHHPLNSLQRTRFETLRRLLPPAPASMANSAGIFLGSAYHYDFTRPGAALYGISRSTGAPKPMKPVISLEARILQLRTVEEPTTIGYGATGQAQPGSRLATVSAGYADGYMRALSNRGYGWLAGVRVPVAGRISMDLTTFDVSAAPKDAAVAGGYIELIGEQQTVDALADEAGTIGYEILTALGQRYERRYRSRSNDDAP